MPESVAGRRLILTVTCRCRARAETESKDLVSERDAGRRLSLTVTCRCKATDEDWVEGLHLDEQRQETELGSVITPRREANYTLMSKRCTLLIFGVPCELPCHLQEDFTPCTDRTITVSQIFFDWFHDPPRPSPQGKASDCVGDLIRRSHSHSHMEQLHDKEAEILFWKAVHEQGRDSRMVLRYAPRFDP